MQNRETDWSRWAAIALGLLFIVGGGLLLAVQYWGLTLPFDLTSFGWPIWVIVPGVAILVIGLVTPAEPGAGLAIAGSIVTAVGLLLAYQYSADHFSSWAYAWALVAPGSVGAGMILWGTLHLRGSMVRSGIWTLAWGLVLFLLGFAFFEGLLHLGGERGIAPLGRQALPIALIVIGVAIVLTRLWPRRRDWSDSWSRPTEPPPDLEADRPAPTE
jgi:hypothetical protein